MRRRAAAGRLGLLLVVLVTAASVQDRDGGFGGPRGCPYYNSPEMQQHRARMWAQRTGATSP